MNLNDRKALLAEFGIERVKQRALTRKMGDVLHSNDQDKSQQIETMLAESRLISAKEDALMKLIGNGEE